MWSSGRVSWRSNSVHTWSCCTSSEEEERFLADHSHTAAAALVDWVAGRTSAPIDFQVIRGAPSTQAARLGRDVDLLVAGTSSIDAAQLGPVTRRLARKSRCAVLAVRRQPRVPYRRVVAAVDLSEHSRKAVELARTLAPAAEITVAYALTSRSDVLLGQSRLFEQDAATRARERLARAEAALDEFAAPWASRCAPRSSKGRRLGRSVKPPGVGEPIW